MTRVLSVALAMGCASHSTTPPVAATSPGTAHVAPVEKTSPPTPPKPLDQDLPRLVDRTLHLYTDLATAFTVAADCTTATVRLGNLRAAFADVIAANAKILHEGRAGELRLVLAPREAAFEASAKSIVESPILATCHADAAFARAFDELVGTP